MAYLYAIIFAVSGAAGLIYESVWSHYIKLILGHAAYAQSLVLVIFMGGMAIGAWAASRRSSRLANLLLAYAIVEGIIGVLALAFHGVFQFSTGLLFDSVIPHLGAGWSISTIKIALSALLILPQSILLGATFPLMSGSLVRRLPAATGSSVALLYFANSLGAVFGVLISGFWLIAAVGLPGTLLVAGCLNIVLAAGVYLLAKQNREPVPESASSTADPVTADAKPSAMKWILWASALTGVASFCYEIAWIRMLSMVLGASTHSFELMLAAFILGLSLGGLWIKRRIDQIAEPRIFLGKVQVVMGALALLTLPLYNYTFDLMSLLLHGLARTGQGYVLFSLFSHCIALLIMLPAAFCAGMTLPLLTLLLWRAGYGEAAIGRVYSVNTLGAIVGVLLAMHVLIPLSGLKGLMLFGALVDGGLGLCLLGWLAVRSGHELGGGSRSRLAWLAGFSLLWLAILMGSTLDPRRMASGVFRTTQSSLSAETQVAYWEDGKTSSVSLVRDHGIVSILTNGKPDAAINTEANGAPTSDESTMTMLAILPLLHHPDMRQVAAIGLGAGQTTHVLLGAPGIQQLDTIEIEPAILRAAKSGYESVSSRTFTDPRSHIHIEDARVFFAKQGKQYDMIVSEPSNPWVSGVASLFSNEFYHHVSRYLASDGVFVQWLHTYESDPMVVASILNAMDDVFADYRVYTATSGDMVIVASPHQALRDPDFRVLALPLIDDSMKHIGFQSHADIQRRYLGNKAFWSPWAKSRLVPPNSDFFPYVDTQAARFRFLNGTANSLLDLRSYPIPVLDALRITRLPDPAAPFTSSRYYDADRRAGIASHIREAILQKKPTVLPVEVQAMLAVLQSPSPFCAEAKHAQTEALDELSGYITPALSATDLSAIWQTLIPANGCLRKSPEMADWLELYVAIGQHQHEKTSRLGSALLERETKIRGSLLEHLLVAKLTADLALGNKAGFYETVEKYLIPARRQGKMTNHPIVDMVLTYSTTTTWRSSASATTLKPK